MTAKEYLTTIKQRFAEMNFLYEKLLMLREKAEGISAVRYDGVKVQAPSSKRIEEAVVKLDAIERKYERRVCDYFDGILEAVRMIYQMEDERHTKVLSMRYLDCRSWREIAEDLGYSYRQATRLHGEALKEFSKKYQNVLKCPISI